MIKIPAGKILSLTGDALSAGAVWWAKGTNQLVRAAALVAGTPVNFGPYTNDAEVEVIMTEGSYSQAFLGAGDQVPTLLATQLSVPAMTIGAAVIDCTDGPTAITQLNALLASLRAGGIITT